MTKSYPRLRKQTISLKFSTALAKSLKAMGRKPSSYHGTQDDDCKSCAPIDRDLGIWSQNLAVLRSVTMPAVLLEVGVIVDSDDEKIINREDFRRSLANLILSAVPKAIP